MNGLRLAFAVMKNDFLLFKARPSSTLLAILVPINFLILFTLFAIGGARVPVTVLQGDGGHFGTAMVQALNSTHTFRYHMVGRESAASAAIRHHTSVASIQIPSGLSQAVSKGKNVALPVTIDNLNSDFANDIRRAMPLAILNFYHQTMPQVLPMGWHEVDQYPHDVSFLDYLAVSIQTVALLLGGILLTGRGVSGEWERGTIKELKLAPIPAWAIITGKMATGFISSLASALLVLGALLLLGVRPENWWLFIGVMLLTLFVFVSIGMAVGTLIRSQFVIYPLVLGIGLPLFFISGPFGPVSWSTPAMLFVARVFPVIYANTVFQRAIHGYWPLDVGAATVAVVFAVWAVGALSLSVWLFRRATSAH